MTTKRKRVDSGTTDSSDESTNEHCDKKTKIVPLAPPATPTNDNVSPPATDTSDVDAESKLTIQDVIEFIVGRDMARAHDHDSPGSWNMWSNLVKECETSLFAGLRFTRWSIREWVRCFTFQHNRSHYGSYELQMLLDTFIQKELASLFGDAIDDEKHVRTVMKEYIPEAAKWMEAFIERHVNGCVPVLRCHGQQGQGETGVGLLNATRKADGRMMYSFRYHDMMDCVQFPLRR